MVPNPESFSLDYRNKFAEIVKEGAVIQAHYKGTQETQKDRYKKVFDAAAKALLTLNKLKEEKDFKELTELKMKLSLVRRDISFEKENSEIEKNCDSLLAQINALKQTIIGNQPLSPPTAKKESHWSEINKQTLLHVVEKFKNDPSLDKQYLRGILSRDSATNLGPFLTKFLLVSWLEKDPDLINMPELFLKSIAHVDGIQSKIQAAKKSTPEFIHIFLGLKPSRFMFTEDTPEGQARKSLNQIVSETVLDLQMLEEAKAILLKALDSPPVLSRGVGSGGSKSGDKKKDLKIDPNLASKQKPPTQPNNDKDKKSTEETVISTYKEFKPYLTSEAQYGEFIEALKAKKYEIISDMISGMKTPQARDCAYIELIRECINSQKNYQSGRNYHWMIEKRELAVTVYAEIAKYEKNPIGTFWDHPSFIIQGSVSVANDPYSVSQTAMRNIARQLEMNLKTHQLQKPQATAKPQTAEASTAKESQKKDDAGKMASADAKSPNSANAAAAVVHTRPLSAIVNEILTTGQIAAIPQKLTIEDKKQFLKKTSEIQGNFQLLLKAINGQLSDAEKGELTKRFSSGGETPKNEKMKGMQELENSVNLGLLAVLNQKDQNQQQMQLLEAMQAMRAIFDFLTKQVAEI